MRMGQGRARGGCPNSGIPPILLRGYDREVLDKLPARSLLCMQGKAHRCRDTMRMAGEHSKKCNSANQIKEARAQRLQ